MNKDQAKGKWRQLRGMAKKAWGELTDDDFEKAGGAQWISSSASSRRSLAIPGKPLKKSSISFKRNCQRQKRQPSSGDINAPIRRPPSSRQGVANVVDSRRLFHRAVGSRVDNRAHDGRIYSHPPGGRRGRDPRSDHPGPLGVLKLETIDPCKPETKRKEEP